MNRVTLKNIKYSEWNSEETNCFQGVIYFDNKKIGMCSNEGRGGNTYCCPYDIKSKEKFNECEEYCKSLPPIKIESRFGIEGFEIDSNLENVCDIIFEEWLEEKMLKKDEKKLIKNCEKGICFGTLQEYTTSSFKKGGKSVPLSELFKEQKGIDYIKEYCKKKKSEGYTILNKNLPFKI